MTKPISTKQKILDAARAQFWTKGYSNVSVRDITSAAGVDVALVSRYFGGKLGLFEATLADLPGWEALEADPEDVVRVAVASFSQPFDPKAHQISPYTMLLVNIIDPEIGDRVRALVQQGMAAPLAKKLGGPNADARAATLLASLFGMALMRKNFQLDALRDLPTSEVEARTFALALAAVEHDS